MDLCSSSTYRPRCILLQEGEFEGVVCTVTNVKFPMYKDDGSLVSLEEAEKIPLTFDYDILYNKENKWHEESKDRFVRHHWQYFI